MSHHKYKTEINEHVFKNFRNIFFYGLCLAALVFTLKIMQWKFLIVDNATDIYIALIAAFFTLLGIWIAKQLIIPKEKMIIIEKEIPEEHDIDESNLKMLNLSNREYEVLNFLSKGHSNKEIAENLYLSISTVKTHVSNLYTKLDVKSRTQAAEKAKRLKIIR